MDNFSGIFGDGELENLELTESYAGSQPPASSAVPPTSEMEQTPYQSSSNATKTSSLPTQKMAIPTQPPIGNFTNQPSYQYPPNPYPGQPYRGPYPGSDMYNARPAMPTNQSMQGWSGTQDQIGQVPSNYQPPYSMSAAPTPNNYPPQVAGHMPPGYQNVPTQNMNQPYPGTPPQGMSFQSAQRAPYPGYDPQKPASPGMGSYGASSGPPNQSYSMMQNPRQPYHLGNFPGHPSPEMSQFSNSPIANGTSSSYRPPYAQTSQVSRQQQLSPMPRSRSPHPRVNANLPMSSPVSSPAALPPNPSPNNAAPPTSLQQLEGMVNTNSNGGNTPNSPSVPVPMQSPGLYGNNSVHSPHGPRGSMSPGLGNRPPNPNNVASPCPPMSPQQWQQPQRPIIHQNYMSGLPQGVAKPVRQSSSPSNITGPIVNSTIADSICSANDSPKTDDSFVGAGKESLTSNVEGNSLLDNKDDENIESKPAADTGVNGVGTPVVESQGHLPSDPNVPSASVATTHSSVPEVHSTTSIHPSQSIAAQSTSSTETECTSAAPTFNMPNVTNTPNPNMPSLNQYGNTMPRYSAPQGHHIYPPQGYRYSSPMSYGPQGPRPGHINSMPVPGHPQPMSAASFSNEGSPGAPMNPDKAPNTPMSSESSIDSPKFPNADGSVSDHSVLNGTGQHMTHPMVHPSGAPEQVHQDSMGPQTSIPGGVPMGSNPMMQPHGPPMVRHPGSMPLNGPRQPMHMLGPSHPIQPGQHMGGMRQQNPMMMGPMGMPMMRHPMPSNQGGMQHPQALNMEIQNLQQQIQQMYKMPQNVQTQQTITEMQQKLAHLQQQQQQQQQQYYQPMYQPPQAAAEVGGKSPKKKTPAKPRVPKESKTPKPKKETKPKEVKAKKEPRPKTPKEPKEPKTPKPKKTSVEPKRARGKKETNKIEIIGPDGMPIPMETTDTLSQPSILDQALAAVDDPIDTSQIDPVIGIQPTTPSFPSIKPKTDKKPKVKSAAPAKKKPSAKLNLNFKKKKRRRGSESDFSDGEGPPLMTTADPKDEDEANKRRSGRIQGSRKKYVDELDLDLSEDDDAAKEAMQNGEGFEASKPNLVYVDPNSEDQMAVQFILQTRIGEREVISDSEDEEHKIEDQKKPPRKIEVEEYYVKYKAFSYLHCEWRTAEELMKGDKRIQSKIKRFKDKKLASQNLMDFLEEEAYNPDYVEVDRVLDSTESADPTTGKVTRQFLVKWKSLPYEDATWETEEDVPLDKVASYNSYKDPPPRIEHKLKRRPKPEEWKKEEVSPVYKNNNGLREYQLEGLNWLTFSYYNGHNCILADEMGLGKTIQSLSLIDSIYRYGIRGPFLIIAPLSTIPNWQREFEGWTDLNIVVYHGSQLSRNMILEYEMYYKDERGERLPNIYRFNVLITTFEVIISDCADLKEIQWRCCIIDEAHRLKNRNCKLLEGLRLMNLEHRVLLSGTPLQNNVNELFSLLNFLEPLQFASQDDFLKEFGTLESEDQVKKLQALLKPMMLRRMKEDVEKSLAPKEETIIEVELTNIQKKYYRAILERNFDFLVKGATYANVPSLMNTMMELRKCCLHPYLLNGAEEAIQSTYKESHKGETGDPIHNALVQSSGKLVLVDKLLPRLKENGHRVLIFSQMVRLLDIIEDYLIGRKYPYERLDGRIRGNLRQAAIDRFCKPDSDRFVFLLCTKAGGLGINLTAADTVIIYDSDWNPQNDLQAQARCHRIGQQKSVKIYRLLCRNTYEREMFDKASLKLGLDKAVLQSMNTDGKNSSAGGNSLGLSKKDIENLLKKGAYGALMDDDNQADKFCEEDIDSIMSRRATVIQLESEKGSTFSKASFSASNTRSDIDVDDPEFWKKWAKSADIDIEAGEKKKQLIMEEPRRRSQIRRYGHDEGLVDCSDLESSASDSDRGEDGIDDVGSELRMRTRRGRGRGRSMRSCRLGGRATRASRWANEEEILDGDNVKYGYWGRSECFKVEKGLLTFGWGRWKEIRENNDFRTTWRECDIMDCARMILLFCIRYYKGDDKIKGFIFDLISPMNDGKPRVYHNHIGLSAPVPRGRKGKKKLREAKLIASHMEGADWAKDDKYDTEMFLDQGYSRHLTRHANKVLLRVRLLFYIRQEIIGDLSTQIEDGIPASDLPIHPPQTDMAPKTWWDTEADKSILVGVYKHGYDRYNVMRNDPSLCFLSRCGPPDKAALMAEMVISVNEDEMETDDKEDDGKDDEDSNATPGSPAASSITNKSDDDSKTKDKDQDDKKNLLPFPSASDMNGRLRRLVTSYQRNNKKIEMRKEASGRGFDHYLADKMIRRERMAEYIRDRELRKADYNQRRWSNREQAEFYRTVSTFGVEYDREERRYDWTKFRSLSRLEKRQDENLTEYFKAFMAMCKRQCGIRVTDQENTKIMESGVDRLPEERARRVLERVELLNRIRSDVLPHPDLKKALELALPCKDLPDWWIPGKHDYDLVKGVARHGLGRTDYYVAYDSDLSFREIVRRNTAGEPLITEEEKEYIQKKYYATEKPVDDKDSKELVKSKLKVEPKAEQGEDLTVKKEPTAESSSEQMEVDKSDADEKPCETKVEPTELEEASAKKEVVKTETSETCEGAAEPEKSDDTTKPQSDDTDKTNNADSTEKTADDKSKGDQGPLGSLQQMDDEMAKMEPILPTDSQTEPTVAQLLAQSTANSFQWAKERVLQTRLEHIIKAVETSEWPVSIDFVSNDQDIVSLKCDTPPSAPSTPNPHDIIFLESERKRRRQYEKEVERAQIQAMLHPNLHQNLELSKIQSSAAAIAAFGFNPATFSSAHLRSLFEVPDKKASAESQANALKQLQALQGSLDLTVKPVASQGVDISSLTPRRGPGRPRIDEHSRNSEKKRKCDSPQDNRPDKRRKKLDEIVLGLTSKGKDDDPLALLKGSSVTLHPSSKDRLAETSAKLSSSLSITPANHKSDKDTSSKSCLVKNAELPPGISLPPGIELYRPTDSAKVDKWLEQHQDLLADSRASKESSKRKADQAVFDWSQFSGDERVDVIHGKTGQKLTGDDAPKLKYLTKWLAEHPVYEIDPQWVTDKEKGGDSALSRRPDKQALKSNSSSKGSSKNFSQGLDAQLSLVALAKMDPKLLQFLDQKTLASLGLTKSAPALDPKLLLAAGALDPKLLASLGIDPKLLETSKQEVKTSKKPSPAPSPQSKAPSPKPSTSHAVDPKLLAGLDPQLLQSLDAKTLASLDPKLLGLDPSLLMPGFDPKLLAMMTGGDKHNVAGVDSKLLGLEQQLMLLASLGVPGLPGISMGNHMLSGLQTFGMPSMQAMQSSSKSKDNQRNVAASQANNLFFGGGGAAGLMYPPLGLGLSNFGLPSISSALLNGLGSPITVSAGPSKQTAVTPSKKSDDKKDSSKTDKSAKTDRHTLKQMKAERLNRAEDNKFLESIPDLHQLDVTLERVPKGDKDDNTNKEPTQAKGGGEDESPDK